MKKSLIGLAVILLSALIVTGCCESPSTQLTIVNNTGYDLEMVQWNGYYFTTGEVWDDGLNDYCSALLKGTSATRLVSPGSTYISYWHVNGSKYYTDTVSVTPREHNTFVIVSYASNGVLIQSDFTADKKTEWQKAKATGTNK